MNQQPDVTLKPTAWRGRMLHALDRERLEYWPDGGLRVNEEGLIEACGNWQTLAAAGWMKGIEVLCLRPDQLLIPGLVDLHTHLPQLDAIGRPAPDLLRWLETHIYPAEAKLADPSFARDISERFFKALLSNGTTTAAVFLTSHHPATDIAFETAEALGNRVIMGLNLMDRNQQATGSGLEKLSDGLSGNFSAASALFRPADALLEDTEALCRRWHGAAGGRLQYAWMPRFAPACSEELLAGIGGLRHRYPEVYFHTHIAEQTGEIAEVQRLFPWAADYTDAYERFHLLGKRSILAHGVHLSDDELSQLQRYGCSLAHCPGSNLFLNSGRFRLFDILQCDMRLGLATDVAAGPSVSLFQAMRDAQRMQAGFHVPPVTLFYLATLGAAEALAMADRIGNFAPGKAADFVILAMREQSQELPEPGAIFTNEAEALAADLVHLGDKKSVGAVFIGGRKVHE